uniref:RNA-dependent RNA polymerase n=1 Tax=Riboviria sp. TaxID=2585031 RepID=A0A514D2H6_9VIRU|nr:MAG: RNA-dependent RNA polymerase [Riboviria sp.]
MEKLGTPKPEARLVDTPDQERLVKPVERRPPMLAGHRLHALGVLQPHPDVTDKATMEAGAQKRAAAQTPSPERAVLEKLRAFVRQYVRREFRQLGPEDDVSYETWREAINQPEWRKKEYDEAYDRVRFTKNSAMRADLIKVMKLAKLGGFGKREQYPQFKHARCINARNDKYKVLVGPIYRAIEKIVFAQPDFIKKIPVADRPQYILDRLFAVGAMYGITDFSRFEASFIQEVQEAIEFEMYDWIAGQLNEADWFRELTAECQLGENTIDYHTFMLVLIATRMSGEMCTSLGNGFTNNIILKFIAHESDALIVPCNEGDDGIFRTTRELRAELFAKLGFEIKISYTTELSEASFCGMIFDIKDRVVITDPVKVLANFGWIDSKFVGAKSGKKNAMLRLKALSLLYQYPGCPVLQSLAEAVLRLTSGVDVREEIAKTRDPFRREVFRDAFAYFGSGALHVQKQHREVPYSTRELMYKKFGVPVEAQIEAEKFFDSLESFQPFYFWWLSDLAHPDCVSYYLQYVRAASKDELVWPAFNITRPFQSIDYHITIPLRRRP